MNWTQIGLSPCILRVLILPQTRHKASHPITTTRPTASILFSLSSFVTFGLSSIFSPCKERLKNFLSPHFWVNWNIFNVGASLVIPHFKRLDTIKRQVQDSVLKASFKCQSLPCLNVRLSKIHKVCELLQAVLQIGWLRNLKTTSFVFFHKTLKTEASLEVSFFLKGV